MTVPPPKPRPSDQTIPGYSGSAWSYPECSRPTGMFTAVGNGASLIGMQISQLLTTGRFAAAAQVLPQLSASTAWAAMDSSTGLEMSMARIVGLKLELLPD